jgi:hypothetical protein
MALVIWIEYRLRSGGWSLNGGGPEAQAEAKRSHEANHEHCQQ